VGVKTHLYSFLSFSGGNKMLITGLEQVNGFYENIKVSGIEKKEDIYSLFQAVTDIIDDPDTQLRPDWYPHWMFKHPTRVDWYISLFDDCMLCGQVNGMASVGLGRIPYHLIESVSCDLFIDGSRLVGIWITLKNGVEIRLM
jgi:hypothetical protein